MGYSTNAAVSHMPVAGWQERRLFVTKKPSLGSKDHPLMDVEFEKEWVSLLHYFVLTHSEKLEAIGAVGHYLQ